MNIEATANQASLAAAARLYRLHSGEVYRYAARRLGETLAVDVTAEVFRVAIERYPTFDALLGHERAWLYGIASNLIRTHWRTEQRRLRALSREQSLASAPCDPLLRVEERVDADSALTDVMNAVAELSQDDRDLLTLFAWECCSYAEIAEALCIPIGTVRSRLNRIRKGIAPRHPDEVPGR
jgi:RNA polymerase sigma-70 factor (ECF subfamily)